MKRRGEVLRLREEFADARSQMDKANTPEARILAERRAATVLGSEQLGGAAFATDRKDVKLLAARAVAAVESPEVAAASDAQNREAATNTDAFYTGGDDLDWSKPPTPPAPPKP